MSRKTTKNNATESHAKSAKDAQEPTVPALSQTAESKRIRRRIEAFGTAMSLPTVRRALGVIEGEHASNRRGGVDELMDIRPYESGDESRAIDWKISARVGRPMVVQRERLVSSHVYLLMDVGREMTEVCPSGERAFEVAANAICMFAALSLRRSDDVSLVFGDSASITRVPFHGGFAQFERTIDDALKRPWASPRNIGALLDYAAKVRDRDALIVLATDEHGLNQNHSKAIRRIARTHPLVIIDVTTINPFMADPVRGVSNMHVADARTHRRVPAFLRTKQNVDEVATHRAYVAQALNRELSRVGAQLVQADSSNAMFRSFVRMISQAQSGSASVPHSHLRAGAFQSSLTESANGPSSISGGMQ